MTLVGGFIFFALERSTALANNALYVQFMRELNATLSCVGSVSGPCAHFSTANGTAMYERLINSYLSNPTALSDNWNLRRSNLYLFAFTILSTIGYGTFTPITPGGQMFTILYALARCLLAIPAA